MDLRLSGKRVLVTGASGHIGRTIAATFGAEDARVAVGYHRDEPAARRTAEEVTAAGGTAELVRIDLADPEQARAAATEPFGGLDILINNAVAWPLPAAPGESFESVPLERLRSSVEANLVGQYALTQAAVASMRSTAWGRVVFVSTGLVEDGFSGSAPYTAPKAALHGLARTMSRELASEGILTNVVMAGFVPHGEIPEAIVETASRSAATGRPTRAWEIANAIAFLASEANGHVTGESIRVDGHFLAADPNGTA